MALSRAAPLTEVTETVAVRQVSAVEPLITPAARVSVIEPFISVTAQDTTVEFSAPSPTKGSMANAAQPVSDDRFRVALGYGWGIAAHAGDFKVFKGRLDLDSFAGSSGRELSVQTWLDHWPFSDMALGLEYLSVDTVGRAQMNLPHGVSVFTDPTTFAAQVEAHAQMGMLNAAYRPSIEGPLHPSLGAGLGVGRGSASAEYSFHNAFLGSDSKVASVGSPIGAVQAFMGLDVDLGDYAYLSLMPRIFWATGHPLGLDQSYRDFIVGSMIGVRL